MEPSPRRDRRQPTAPDRRDPSIVRAIRVAPVCDRCLVDEDVVAAAPELLALVDVELFVSSGAPRAAFVERVSDDRSVPMFNLDRLVLKEAGWAIDGSGPCPPAVGSDLKPAPHPYALGPQWSGVNCWRADFGDEMMGTVDHDWCTEEHEPIVGGVSLASGSPWRWAFSFRNQNIAGRAESPLHAAGIVEALALCFGAAVFELSPTPDDDRSPR